MAPTFGERALEAAERAVITASSDPLLARSMANEVLADQGAGPEAWSVALRALAVVERDLGEIDAAYRHIRKAVRTAQTAGLSARAVQARLTLASVFLQQGRTRRALAELTAAAEVAPRELLGPALFQRALVLIRTGEFDEALITSRRALPIVRRAGDRSLEAAVLSNRGILHGYRGELARAEDDLTKALTIYHELQRGFAEASVRHNLGYVAALAGDVPRSLRYYDDAAVDFEALGAPLPGLHVDRAEVLLSARLLPEARLQIEQGVEALRSTRPGLDLAEAQLLRSQVALAEGDYEGALDGARQARHQLSHQGRDRWAVLARFAESQARWAAGVPVARLVREALSLASALESAGWNTPGLDCRLVAARAALVEQNYDAMNRLLRGFRNGGKRGPATFRIRCCHAQALARLANGNRTGALSALRKGLSIADEQRATLGATELRVRSATSVSDLAELGLSLAFDSKRAFNILRWSERWRSGALRAPRAIPPSDARLASLLTLLRDTVARIEQAALAGISSRSLIERQRRIEGDIRERSRRVTGSFSEAPSLPSSLTLRDGIGDRALVELIEHRGSLFAVVGTKEGFRLRELGSLAEAAAERQTLQFALSRLSLRRSPQVSLDAAAMLLHRSCNRLDELLLLPLRPHTEGRSLIVVPTGDLHALPWAFLPSLRGCNVTVAPSAALWWSREAVSPARARRSRAAVGVVLVAGPRVSQARQEIGYLRKQFYGDADVLQGMDATAGGVAKAFEGRKLAHVAAHGTFRADNAQFSSLELADGPLTVYDLERIRRPPEWMVLSACDAGRSEVHPGDELMGTSAALLAMGTRAIVSSVAPVPDDGVMPVMVSLHTALSSGAAIAEALSIAQGVALSPNMEARDMAVDTPESRAALAAGAFVCLGAG